MNNCSACGEFIQDCDTYEYRGALSCADCFDKVIVNRDTVRREIINEENHKIKALKGLVLDDSSIGLENRKLMGRYIEIASIESHKLKTYEGR